MFRSFLYYIRVSENGCQRRNICSVFPLIPPGLKLIFGNSGTLLTRQVVAVPLLRVENRCAACFVIIGEHHFEILEGASVYLLQRDVGMRRSAGPFRKQRVVREDIIARPCLGSCDVGRRSVYQGIDVIRHVFGKIIRPHAGNDQFGNAVLVQILQGIADAGRICRHFGKPVLP